MRSNSSLDIKSCITYCLEYSEYSESEKANNDRDMIGLQFQVRSSGRVLVKAAHKKVTKIEAKEN